MHDVKKSYMGKRFRIQDRPRHEKFTGVFRFHIAIYSEETTTD